MQHGGVPPSAGTAGIRNLGEPVLHRRGLRAAVLGSALAVALTGCTTVVTGRATRRLPPDLASRERGDLMSVRNVPSELLGPRARDICADVS